MPASKSPCLSLRSRETFPAGIRRVARQQIEVALKLIRRPSFNTELVHEVRKCVKKLRAILRLVSREVGNGHFREENRKLRETGRSLSRVRDAEVYIETLNHLVTHTSLDPTPYKNLYAKLHEQRSLLYSESKENLRAVEKNLLRLRKTLPSWELGNTNLEDLLKTITRTYRKGREAIQQYVKAPSHIHLHTVRKRTKDVWYQLSMMQAHLSQPTNALIAQSGQVSHLAGLARDYAMLADFVNAQASDAAELQLAARLGGTAENFALAAKRQFILFYKESPSHFLVKIRPITSSGRVRSRFRESRSSANFPERSKREMKGKNPKSKGNDDGS